MPARGRVEAEGQPANADRDIGGKGEAGGEPPLAEIAPRTDEVGDDVEGKKCCWPGHGWKNSAARRDGEPRCYGFAHQVGSW